MREADHLYPDLVGRDRFHGVLDVNYSRNLPSNLLWVSVGLRSL